MVGGHHNARVRALVGALGMAVLVSACAHVGREEFQTEVDRLRQEMAEGDRTVAERAAAQVEGVDRRVEALEAQMGELEEGLRMLAEDFDMKVERLEASLRVHLPVHFAFDDDRIDPSQRAVLDRVGSVLHAYYPEAVLTVEGMTDPAGDAEYNMKLGLRRAETVRGHLIEGGWPEGRIRAVSYGESVDRLILAGAGGRGEVGKANRRAVVVIDHPEGAKPLATVAEAGGSGN